MDKHYNISNIDFNGEWMTLLSVDRQTYQILVAQASKRLALATDTE